MVVPVCKGTAAAMRMCATPMSAVPAAASKLRSLVKSCPNSWVVCMSTDAPGSLMQWPPLLRPLTQLSELPQPVLERYNAVRTVAFCGVFPEIRRAWASVDNELFLWRLDRWWGPSRWPLQEYCCLRHMRDHAGARMRMRTFRLTCNPLLSQERCASELRRGAAGNCHCPAGAATARGVCGGDQSPVGHLHHNRGKRAVSPKAWASSARSLPARTPLRSFQQMLHACCC